MVQVSAQVYVRPPCTLPQVCATRSQYPEGHNNRMLFRRMLVMFLLSQHVAFASRDEEGSGFQRRDQKNITSSAGDSSRYVTNRSAAQNTHLSDVPSEILYPLLENAVNAAVATGRNLSVEKFLTAGDQALAASKKATDNYKMYAADVGKLLGHTKEYVADLGNLHTHLIKNVQLTLDQGLSAGEELFEDHSQDSGQNRSLSNLSGSREAGRQPSELSHSSSSLSSGLDEASSQDLGERRSDSSLGRSLNDELPHEVGRSRTRTQSLSLDEKLPQEVSETLPQEVSRRLTRDV